MTNPTESTVPDIPEEATHASSAASDDAGEAPRIMQVAHDGRRTALRVVDAPVVVLTLAVTLAFLMFLLIEPTPGWIALAGAVAAGAGTDRVLRLARARSVDLGIDPTPQVLLPALYALAVPVLLEELSRGWWTLLGGLGAGLGFGAILVAQVHSVRPNERWLAFARPATSAAVYITAFALFSLTYVFELGLPAALAAVAFAAGLLAIELLRDDGAVVYLNGTEIHRSNMPEGDIDYQTRASVAVGGERSRHIFPRRSLRIPSWTAPTCSRSRSIRTRAAVPTSASISGSTRRRPKQTSWPPGPPGDTSTTAATREPTGERPNSTIRPGPAARRNWASARATRRLRSPAGT